MSFRFVQASWTPLHGAIHMGHADCLTVLLTPPSAHDKDVGSLENVVKMADKDGLTVGHLAAIRDDKVRN